MYEAGIVDAVIYNMVNGKTEDERIYSIRVLFNLSYNSEIKARNYQKVFSQMGSVLSNENVEVRSQALLLLRKLLESQKSNVEQDLRLLEPVVRCAKHEALTVFEKAMATLQTMVLNNAAEILFELQNRHEGVRICVNFY